MNINEVIKSTIIDYLKEDLVTCISLFKFEDYTEKHNINIF